jgi:hypothetical protein
MFSQSYDPLGYQQLAANSTAQALTVPAGANCALFAVETANVRWRDDGVAPTTSAGMPIVAGAAPFFYSGTLSALQFIAESGSPLVNVSYYRPAG